MQPILSDVKEWKEAGGTNSQVALSSAVHQFDGKMG